MQGKVQKKFFVFEVNALKMLESVAFVKKRILVIGSQWVNKQSDDFAYNPGRLSKAELFS